MYEKALISRRASRYGLKDKEFCVRGFAIMLDFMGLLMDSCHHLWKHLDIEEIQYLHELYEALEELMREQETGDPPEPADSEVGEG